MFTVEHQHETVTLDVEPTGQHDRAATGSVQNLLEAQKLM